jgi:hypothetical protein
MICTVLDTSTNKVVVNINVKNEDDFHKRVWRIVTEFKLWSYAIYLDNKLDCYAQPAGTPPSPKLNKSLVK